FGVEGEVVGVQRQEHAVVILGQVVGFEAKPALVLRRVADDSLLQELVQRLDGDDAAIHGADALAEDVGDAGEASFCLDGRCLCHDVPPFRYSDSFPVSFRKCSRRSPTDQTSKRWREAAINELIFVASVRMSRSAMSSE